jgi:hypothetical protein
MKFITADLRLGPVLAPERRCKEISIVPLPVLKALCGIFVDCWPEEHFLPEDHGI